MANLNDCYNDVIQSIDFERIRQVMQFLDWKYYGHDNIPTIEQLKRTCKELFDQACAEMIQQDTDFMTVSSGGFWVTVSKYEKGYCCKILFAIEDGMTSTDELENIL